MGKAQIVDAIRIFVVSDNILFSCGLRSLLTPAANLVIIGEETDIDRAIKQIEMLRPDVVIWGGSGPKDGAALEELNLLKAEPGAKVIGLSMQSNDLFIYRASHKVVHDVKDLVEAIESSEI